MSNIIKKITSRSLKLLSHREYIPTEYFIFNDKKLVYISIPKVACTSIKTGLMAADSSYSESQNTHMDIHASTKQFMSYAIGREHEDYYKIAFVRNPLDRLVSCYKDKIKNKKQHTGRYHFDTNYNNIIIKSIFRKSFSPDMSFEEFVGLVARIPDFLSDGHFKSQHSMLYKKGKKVPDYIGKFEKLEKDWEHIASQYNLKMLAEMNRTKADDWKDYYKNKKTLELAANRYKSDIESFDYSAEYKSIASKF